VTSLDIRQPRIMLTAFRYCAMWLVLGISIARAQPPTNGSRTVWDGVYTTAQAERGKAGYTAKCRGCHNDDLSGYQAVLTNQFLPHWREDNLDSFYATVKSTMPRGAPATLDDEVYIDIVAFILQANHFPPGTKELTASALPNIRVEGKSGPVPLSTGALVHVVGCLVQRADDAWALIRATKPVRTRNPNNSMLAELKAQDVMPLGEQTFGLMDASGYRPDSQKGYKVAAKGFLIRTPEDDRINLTALQKTGSVCER